MLEFLKTLPDALIGVAALFSWIPMVWVVFKIIEWRGEANEKKLEELHAEFESAPPWENDPGYWEKAQPSVASEQSDNIIG